MRDRYEPMKTPQPGVSAWLAIGLLVLSGVACSLLRPKRPLNWHLTLQVEGPVASRADATHQTITVIKRRLDAAGVSNFEIKPDGDPEAGRILLNLPSTPDRDRIAKLITDEGKLELTAVVSPPNPAPAQTYATKEEAIASLSSDGTIPSNRRVLPYAERMELSSETTGPSTKKWVVIESPAIVDGSELRNAQAATSTQGGDNHEIQFSLTKTGGDRFGAWTGSHINQYLGIVLNDEVKSIAFIKSQITDQGVITGRFTKQAAQDLALVLKSGALPARVQVVEEKFDKAK
jgi:preprotein translocase subunit SecD